MIDETDDALALLQIDDDREVTARATLLGRGVVRPPSDVAWATAGTPTSATAHATPSTTARERSDRWVEWTRYGRAVWSIAEPPWPGGSRHSK
jgi:hypothetical protein